MSKNLHELLAKKQRLQLVSAALREQIAEDAAALQPKLATVNKLVAGVAWLRSHPAAVIAAVLAVAAAKPRGVWGLIKRGWLLWLAARKLRGSTPVRLMGKAAGWRKRANATS